MSRPHFHHFVPLIALMSAIVVTSCSPGMRVAARQPIQTDAAVGSQQFEQATQEAVKMPWVGGNRAETLVNGKDIFPAMLKAVRSAQKSITFETYAFVEGKVAYEFVNAICQKAKEGVKVHLILDAIGAKYMGEQNADRMRSAGVDLRFYHQFSIFNPMEYNIRDHRKIMVVDGKIGFSGGCGIGDAWAGDAHTKDHWRETHYQLTGPVVAQLQHGFNENWVKCGAPELTGPDYFPRLSRTGTLKACAFNSAPEHKLYTIPHLFRQAIASARKSIIIQNSYVYLDRIMMAAILDARKRGVHVEFIVPCKHTDSWPVRYLSLYQYDKLLGAGVHIYEYQASMIHTKVMVVDEEFTAIGSANFDPRSLYINDESNVNVLGKSFAKKQLRVIARDKLKCKRITKAPNPRNPLSFPPRAVIGLIGSQL